MRGGPADELCAPEYTITLACGWLWRGSERAAGEKRRPRAILQISKE